MKFILNKIFIYFKNNDIIAIIYNINNNCVLNKILFGEFYGKKRDQY